MGTRNLTIVKVQGKVKIAQYGQWDGYPSGQGRTIAEFIQNKMDLEVFKRKVRDLKWTTKKQVADAWVKCGADPKSDTVSFDVSDKFHEAFPQWGRDTGAGILELVQDGTIESSKLTKGLDSIQIKKSGYKVTHVQNDLSFLKDGLFCEYAYEIDLDKQTVTVYTGGKNKFGTYTFKQFVPGFMKMLEKQMSDHKYGSDEETGS
jgi:hypothetical protein